MKRKITTYVALILVILFVITSLIIPIIFKTRADSVLDNIKHEKQEAHQALIKLKKDKKTVSDEKVLLDKSILNIQERIDGMRSAIAASEAATKSKSEELQSKTKELEEIKSKYKEKIVDIYENGQHNQSSVIIKAISSKNLKDLINKIDTVSEILENDKNLKSKVEKICKDINSAKVEIESKKSEQEKLKQELDSQIKNLQEQSAEKQKQIDEIQSDVQKYQDIERQKIQEEEKLLNSIRKQQKNMKITYTGTGMIWPVPSCRSISSPFGMRTHPILKTQRFHTGIDIPASYGSNILATDSGTVIKASYYGGYGNCVIILHDSGLSTLYGHGSSILVNKGQRVEKGQVIMKVGSSGMSTGAHLHCEVIGTDGQRVNPVNYFN